MASDIRWYTDHAAETAFTISTADELAGLADIVNGDTKGIKRYDFKGKTVKLAADIDLSPYAGDSGWSPIGNKYIDIGDGIDDRVFAGTFDGGGHTISNLAINRPDHEGHHKGLFGCVSGGAVKNLKLTGVSIKGANFVGCVAGYVAGGSVTNSRSTGEVGGHKAVGGIVGCLDGGKVENSYSTAEVSGHDEIGGVVGSVCSAGSGVSRCVALNPSVKSIRNRPNVGRVAGKSADGATISNNAAYDGMKNGAGNTDWPNSTAADKALNGQTITADKIRAAGLEIPGVARQSSQTQPQPQPPQQTMVAEPKIFDGRDFTDPVAGDMVAVKGGTFMMGATEDQGDDFKDPKRTAHLVTVGDYYIGKYPVTQNLWKLVMAGTPIAEPSHFKGSDLLPVENVSWDDIVHEFLPRLNALTGKEYRLPTEAEWEYAARGGIKSKGYKFAGGNDIGEVAWYKGNNLMTNPVGIKAPNELGVCDMSGNVCEWVNDWYENYSSEAQTNPKGPSSGSVRVYRGGCWHFVARSCRVSARAGIDPDYRDKYIGFRLAVTQQSSQPQPQPQPQPQAAVAEPEVGAVYEGTVKTIVEFGAFVEYLPGKDGLLHISELDDKRVNKVEDVIRLGEKVRVKVIGFDRMGKVKLSLKAALQNPKQVAVAESKIFDGRDFTDLVVGDMVAVRGGTFMMGATEEQGNDCGDDEKPVHKVTLSDYCIGKYPVTQRLWKRVMVGTPLADPSEFKGDDLPIENVSWNDIVNEFIPRLNAMTGKAYRLPTEAEWEYAARGGNKSRGYKYSGSNTINDIAWYTDNSDSKTHVVGTKLPNELGIYDMCGNVWEWVNDWDEAYGSGAQTNPKGPLSGSTRMGRGGGWDCVAVGCRVSSRDGGNPDFRSFNIGFRLALSP